MNETVARFIVGLAGAHLAVGVLLLPWWYARGLARLDAGAKGGPWGFRLLISPALVALWPFLIGRAVRGGGHPAEERNAHRCASHREGA